MFGRGISLVVSKPIPRITPVQPPHEAVAEMLGNDARASDLIEPLVAFDVRFLGDLDGGNLPGIHQDQLRLWGQAGDGATHRL
jgi:hypothetical protein